MNYNTFNSFYMIIFLASTVLLTTRCTPLSSTPSPAVESISPSPEESSPFLWTQEAIQSKNLFPQIQEKKSYLQQVKTTTRGEEHIFSVHITLSPNQIDFIAFHDILGQVYHLTWTPEKMSWEGSSHIPDFIQPQSIIEDFLLIHLPLSTLKEHLKAYTITEEGTSDSNERLISLNATKTTSRQIQRSGSLGYLWTKAQLIHHKLGYQLDITTTALS